MDMRVGMHCSPSAFVFNRVTRDVVVSTGYSSFLIIDIKSLTGIPVVLITQS